MLVRYAFFRRHYERGELRKLAWHKRDRGAHQTLERIHRAKNKGKRKRKKRERQSERTSKPGIKSHWEHVGKTGLFSA